MSGDHALRFATTCLSSGRRAQKDAPIQPLDLPAGAAQGLADLLPILTCGEASAELVFDDASSLLPAVFDPDLRRALRSTADDERRHGVWLAALSDDLPPPVSHRPAREAAAFLGDLATADLGLHLSRVAALDAAVCIVLAVACARNTPIAGCARVVDTFVRIRRDEGRHVRISRRCAAALGVDLATEAAQRRRVLTAFAQLLSTQTLAFAAIGVDLRQVARRFETAALLPLTSRSETG